MDDQKLPETKPGFGNTAGGATSTSMTPGLSQDTMKTIDDTLDQASSMVRTATAKAGSMAQDLVRQAREQMGPTGEVLREQGAKVGDYLTQNVNQYPLAGLLLAGILGYGLAYLIHARWQD